MKKLLLLFVMIFTLTNTWSQEEKTGGDKTMPQEDRNFRIPLIGEKAPSFTAESTNGPLTFPNDFGATWKILFAHPQDFTPVCSSELLELANLQKEFDKLGVSMVVISTDQLDTHEQWIKALEQIEYKGRPNIRIKFPLVDDKKLVVSKKYGMLHPETNSTRYVRGVFIIDPSDVVRAIYFYPMEVGRSTAELIRTIVALKTVDHKAMMTPADWTPGDDVVVPYLPSAGAGSNDPIPEGYYRLSWFMTFRKAAN